MNKKINDLIFKIKKEITSNNIKNTVTATKINKENKDINYIQICKDYYNLPNYNVNILVIHYHILGNKPTDTDMPLNSVNIAFYEFIKYMIGNSYKNKDIEDLFYNSTTNSWYIVFYTYLFSYIMYYNLLDETTLKHLRIYRIFDPIIDICNEYRDIHKFDSNKIRVTNIYIGYITKELSIITLDDYKKHCN